MISMTGFGHAEYNDERIQFTLDIKTYNNRYIDLILNIPSPLNQLESRIRSLVGDYVRRGRIELVIRMKELEEDCEVLVDQKAAAAYHEAFWALAKNLDLEGKPSLDHLLTQDGVLKMVKKRDVERSWIILEQMLKEALVQMNEDRAREGKNTQSDIQGQVDFLSECLETIRTESPEIDSLVKTGLKNRFQEVMGNELDENRILSEVAAYLVRYDINEEISRLASHLAEFNKLIISDDAVGKKLDFLSQEINREINTIGSKTPLIKISRLVVEMKDALEKIREQLRNVE